MKNSEVMLSVRNAFLSANKFWQIAPPSAVWIAASSNFSEVQPPSFSCFSWRGWGGGFRRQGKVLKSA